MQYNTGPPILREEFEIAFKKLKSNKAPGIDELNGELLKALVGYGKDILFKIIGKAYETVIIPKDFEKCIIILIKRLNEFYTIDHKPRRGRSLETRTNATVKAVA